MGEPENPHFHDFGILGRVPEPQNQLYLTLETPRYLTKIKKHSWHILENIYFRNLTILKSENEKVGKDRRRQ